MGPLDSIFCWQALLVALTASGITQFVKTIMDVTWGTNDPTPTPTLDAAKAVGASIRRSKLILNRVVLPATPILAGCLFAMVVPVRPDNLSHYVDTHTMAWWQQYLTYGAWGAACGQFADYGVSKVKDFFGTRREIRQSTPPPAVAVAAATTAASEDHAP